MINFNILEILQQLISFPSITPGDNGSITYLTHILSNLGFRCQTICYEGINNLYAIIGSGNPALCFAGHLDVVEPGPLTHWKYNPFEAVIANGKVYGRGIVDMKGAIACFICAVAKFLEKFLLSGSIIILLSSDEEGNSKWGAEPLTKFLQKNSKKIDLFIVGEPTCEVHIGDTIKVGRRGSINFSLNITGKQGHVAYPQNAVNPINYLLNILRDLVNTPLDEGSQFFSPSNLVVTSIDTYNYTTNVIPQESNAKFNIRFNDLHTEQDLINYLENTINKYTSKNNYSLQAKLSALPFLCADNKYISIVSKSIYSIIARFPQLSTGGGTSDARFYKELAPTIELGLLNTTAHRANENSDLTDLELLYNIYLKILENFYEANYS